MSVNEYLDVGGEKPHAQIDVEVLIVGAGPTGLAAAIELGTRGIRTLLIDGNPRTGTAPRAKTTNVRTRTHLRRWGIADRLAAAAPFGINYPNDMVFVTSLSGYELARFRDAFNAAPERSPYYPEHAQWIPQYRLEAVLLEKVASLSSVDVRFGTYLSGADQDDDGVHAWIVGEPSAESITCRFLIGADGARSRVRQLIGATMEGREQLSYSYNIIFRAPGLAEAHPFGPAAVYWQIGAEGLSTIGPMDRDDVWFFMPIGMDPGDRLSASDMRALIARRTGIDLPYEILSVDSWVASELMADRYRRGRIILAGDACHLHPPAGGYGMNMGVGDGVDLGWKLAATIQGWGGPALLDSYEAERRPTHRAVIAEAIANFASYVAVTPDLIAELGPRGEAARQTLGAAIADTKSREFFTLGTVLGLGYDCSPVIAHEPGGVPPHHPEIYRPTARPGHLLPHAWLPDGRSLYDLLGDGFTLVVGSAADPTEVERVVAAAARLGIPLATVAPTGIDIFALCGASLVLVRPDQHVAWRGDRWEEVWATVIGQDRRKRDQLTPGEHHARYTVRARHARANTARPDGGPVHASLRLQGR